MSAYCTESDLYSFVPRGALTNPGRLVAQVSTALETFTLDVHGFQTNDTLTLRVADFGVIPTPLVEGTTYFVIRVTENTFQLAATSSGAAIDITAAGKSILVITDLPFDESIVWASSIIENMLTAHIVPLEAPFPQIIIETCAELAAGRLLARAGSASVSLSDVLDNTQKRLAKWEKGIPLRGDNVPAAANTAVVATAPYADTRGWSKSGGL